MELSEMQRLKQLDDENRRLKQIVAEQTLDIQALRIRTERRTLEKDGAEPNSVPWLRRRAVDSVDPDYVRAADVGAYQRDQDIRRVAEERHVDRASDAHTEGGRPSANVVITPVSGSTREIGPTAPSVTYSAPSGATALPDAPCSPEAISTATASPEPAGPDLVSPGRPAPVTGSCVSDAQAARVPTITSNGFALISISLCRGWCQLSALVHASISWSSRGDHAQVLERLVPGSLVVNFNLVQHAVTLNRPRAAIDAYARQPSGTRSLRHSIGSYRFVTLTAALHLLGEHERELAEIKVAQKYAPGVLAFLENEAKALAALGRLPELMRVIDRSLSIGPTAGWRLHTPGRLMEHTARELRAHGYVDESREVAARAVEWYRSRHHNQEGPEALRAGLGRVLFLAGQWEEADAVFSRLVAERPDELEYLGHLGPVAACRGDAGRARAISEKLASAGERLGDARARGRYFGAIAAASRAGIAAELGDRERAVELLREAFALGLPHGLHIHNDPSLQVLRDYGPYRELVCPEG